MYHVNLFDSDFKSSAARDAHDSVAVAVALKLFRDHYGHPPSQDALIKAYCGESLSYACTLRAYMLAID